MPPQATDRICSMASLAAPIPIGMECRPAVRRPSSDQRTFLQPRRFRAASRTRAARSFDHLVGASEQGRWDFEAKCFRGREVDDDLEFGRRLHRQVGGFLASEDTVDITGGAPILVDVVNSIRDKTAGG